MLVKKLLCGLAFISLSAKAGLINPIKPLPSLNLHHISIIRTYDFNKSIHGIFCTPADFTKLSQEKNQPPTILYFVKDPQKMTYFGSVMGFTHLLDENNEKDLKEIHQLTKLPIHQQQCGKNSPYPQRYHFNVSFNTERGDKTAFFTERQQILERLQRDGYLEVMAVRVPYMSLFKPILISQQPARLYFTPQQIQLVTSKDVSTQPTTTKN